MGGLQDVAEAKSAELGLEVVFVCQGIIAFLDEVVKMGESGGRYSGAV